MKIGIFTFHWATNYGAILQAFCLQKFLLEQGHDVEIIDYKPSIYDFSWKKILTHPQLWKSIRRQLLNRKKETLLEPFRNKYLYTTKRFKSVNEFGDYLDRYEGLISGSDQVLNPGFTCRGDNGKPSPAYWLGVGKKNTIRIGYAVSFGYETYPEEATKVAMKWVNNFNAIGTREQTGLHILDKLRYNGYKCLVPDPTFLLGKKIFHLLGISIPVKREKYTCVYMLRHEIHIKGDVRYIDEKHTPITMEQWLTTIVRAKRLITNSYHGMIIALFAHVPFAVLVETGNGSGMNDRMRTLLQLLSIENRAVPTVKEALLVAEAPIDFDSLDTAMINFRKKGIDFLNHYL